MTLLVGGNEVTKVLIGGDTFLNQENLWLPYPGSSGKLFYRLKGDSILQLWGFEPVSGTSSNNFHIAVIPGYRFKSWRAKSTSTIDGSVLFGVGTVETGTYGITNNGSTIVLTGTDGFPISVSGCCFFCAYEGAKALSVSGLYPVEIDIEKE
ncbi:hypothetical protein KQI03_03765 [Levilactobacillus brevis]|uniref:hypothetical protein n=1 Tax=Levilactobacillus TaxID=2767886 RepID=UPI001C10A042|nr:hypothetical protein [Levilactobacillus brevis]MBU5273786.1 hypothetical protein [Levilactobacillus brevis]